MILTYFFAPRDSAAHPPCGMFTLPHFIALFITLALVAVGFWFFRNDTRERLKNKTKIVAIVVTVLEGVKIGYNFAYGYTWPDAWIPLAFCSLFIYASWLAGFGKGIFEKLGVGFMIGGCPTAGLLFLIFPTTSLQMHPIYHYLCLYSMLFHGLMLLFGLLHVFCSGYKLNLKTFGYYAAICVIFAIPALVLNGVLGCNMMFLREPFNVPIAFIGMIHDFSQLLYTVLILLAYIACYLVSFGVSKLQSQRSKDE